MLANASGVLAYAHGYPMVAVFDSNGWNLEVPPTYGDVTYADASFYLVRVRAPADVGLVRLGRRGRPPGVRGPAGGVACGRTGARFLSGRQPGLSDHDEGLRTDHAPELLTRGHRAASAADAGGRRPFPGDLR